MRLRQVISEGDIRQKLKNVAQDSTDTMSCAEKRAAKQIGRRKSIKSCYYCVVGMMLKGRIRS